MRYWLIAIWRTMPRSWIIVSLPIVTPFVLLFLWWVFAGLFLSSPDPRQLLHKAELERLLPQARAGDRSAQIRVGTIYRDGLSSKAEPAEAIRWFSEAAKKGDADAQLAMGELYARGQGVRQDFARAAEFYRGATLGRNVQAQFLLGDLYFHGRGVPHDYGQAIEWFRKSALAGHAGAQSVMGSIYEKGFGVDRDPAAAFVWYSLAADNRTAAMHARADIDPREAAARIKASLSRLELRNAERQLAETRRRLRPAG